MLFSWPWYGCFVVWIAHDEAGGHVTCRKDIVGQEVSIYRRLRYTRLVTVLNSCKRTACTLYL